MGRINLHPGLTTAQKNKLRRRTFHTYFKSHIYDGIKNRCRHHPRYIGKPFMGKKQWFSFLDHLPNQCCQCVQHLKSMLKAAREVMDYASHKTLCVLSFWEAGEPTPDGGYRTKYAGKWYETRPVNKTPKCTCGLDDLWREATGK